MVSQHRGQEGIRYTQIIKTKVKLKRARITTDLQSSARLSKLSWPVEGHLQNRKTVVCEGGVSPCPAEVDV